MATLHILTAPDVTITPCHSQSRRQAMSHSITLKSFAELGEALNIEDLTPDDAGAPAEEPQPTGMLANPSTDLPALLESLETATATLATIARRDEEARAVALRDL